MEKPVQKFDLKAFKEEHKKSINDLVYKRYSTSVQLEEIKSRLVIYYIEYEEVREYFKEIGIRYHFLKAAISDSKHYAAHAGIKSGYM